MIDTCKTAVIASLKIEGWKDDRNDHCYAWDYLWNEIKRPQGDCDISAEVSCKVGDVDCNDLVVPLDRCGEVGATYKFKYCNKEASRVIDLKESRLVAQVTNETIVVPELVTNSLLPDTCRTRTITKPLDTCRNASSLSLKVEGWLENTNSYCYAWDFTRFNIRRRPREKCQVSASVLCTVGNRPCDDVVIPTETCNDFEVLLTFQYCNNEASRNIDFLEEKTIGEYSFNTVPEMTKTNLGPGVCHETSTITDGCNSNLWASLKVEGWIMGTYDYCYAWDFNRVFFPTAPTSQPTSSQPTGFGTLSPTTTPSLSAIPTISSTVCQNLTRTEYEDLIVDKVLGITNPADFQDDLSPQSMALDWMLFQDDYVACPDIEKPCDIILQRYVAAVFYFSTDGDGWQECGRQSVRCNPRLTFLAGDPVSTSFSNETWLSGQDECLWGGLACRDDNLCLDRIEFEANNVQGTIPKELQELTFLRWLFLEGENNDDEFDVSKDYITGTIPSELGQLQELLILDLNFNKLSGTIPIEVFDQRR